MYKSIEDVFKVKTPLAEVLVSRTHSDSYSFFFQLLADYGIKLNEQQREAVEAVEGPVQIIAGAGTGKTTVLTSRVGYMISSCGIDPSSILLVTFSRKSSVEMIERLARIPGISRAASRAVTAGTYHSVCLQILRKEGYTFNVLSSEKRKHIMLKIIMKRLKVEQEYAPETVANVISYWKTNLLRPSDISDKVLQNDVSTELKEIYSEYEKMKEAQDLYDFDDMLVETYYLLKFREDVLKKYQSKFQYVLCDEFQDTSLIQYEIIKMLAFPHNNLCIVGDDSQCIYSWRGSSVEYMINFNALYSNCRQFVMDINYRSTPDILGFSNTLIHNNSKQIKKNLISTNSDSPKIQFKRPMTSDDEAESIIKSINEQVINGTNLRDIAIIYRTHATGRAVFDKLLLADIPFVTYGKSTESFYENSFVKPMLSILKIAINPMDHDSIIDVAPVLYLKRNEIRQIIDTIIMTNNGNVPVDLFNQALLQITVDKPDFQKKMLFEKMNAIKKLTKMTAPQAIREIRKGIINYEKQIELDERKTLTIHKEMLLEYLDECEQAARGFSTVQEFLLFVQKVEDKNKEMEELRKIPDLEAVRLMTIHASKGLEFDTVYAIGWSEGILPHQSSISSDGKEKEDSNISLEEALEEERRLGYVCVTRAKKHLYISSPRNHRNNEVECSRFLIEGMDLAVSKGAV